MIITVANQKGGVGKTDLSVNLASSLAKKGKKVLLVDLDPQANATAYLSDKKHKKTASHLLLDPKLRAEEVVTGTAVQNLHVLPGSSDLYAAQVELVNDVGMQFKLKKKLTGLSGYDYVFIDTPPSLGLLTINALTASTHVLVPVQSSYFAMDGTEKLLKTVQSVREDINPSLDIRGFVMTMHDKRNRLSYHMEKVVRGRFGKKVFETVIPVNVDLTVSPRDHKPITETNKNSRGACAYMALAEEFINSK
jgi:chromosome partitioning protein